ncbi:MAG TPA: hypothetical protein VGQ28_15130, partial [Thermoanaerobaculia bacterium]|nr:hypothetical protein [Thermoanaerobaculia bacterium]
GSGQQTSDSSDPGSGGLNVPKNGDVVAVGPIIGVFSKSHQKSILIFNGRERYDEWRFTMDLLSGQKSFQGIGFGGGGPAAGQLSTRWIGRPWRIGNQGNMPVPGVQNGSGPTPSTGFGPAPAKKPGRP